MAPLTDEQKINFWKLHFCMQIHERQYNSITVIREAVSKCTHVSARPTSHICEALHGENTTCSVHWRG